MTVVQDLVKEHRISRDSSGFEAERAFYVDGIGGSSDNRLYAAMTTAGIPQFGDPHPIIPDVLVTKASARMMNSSDQIKVTVTYSIPDPEDDLIQSEEDTADTDGTLRVSTSLANETVWADINGDLLKAEWKSATGGTKVTKYAGIDVQKPQIQVDFSRVESGTPKTAISDYLGKVNSVPWSGFPAGTWLCTNISSTEEQEGTKVDYGFSYNPNGWQAIITVNLTQAQIEDLPPDIESGNGYSAYDIYPTADFNALGLSF
jgi:hypothetical protein